MDPIAASVTTLYAAILGLVLVALAAPIPRLDLSTRRGFLSADEAASPWLRRC